MLLNINESGRVRAGTSACCQNYGRIDLFSFVANSKIKSWQGLLTMERELNSPGEMLRRIAFIIYIGCWTATLVHGALALLQFHTQAVLLTLPAVAFCLAMKRGGERYLDFHRLARSFPLGDPADRLPHSLRKEAEELLQRLAADKIAWQDRHESRQRLRTLIEKDPRLLSIFRTEIAARCPTLLRGTTRDA
jgi:hypothetical protein